MQSAILPLMFNSPEDDDPSNESDNLLNETKIRLPRLNLIILVDPADGLIRPNQHQYEVSLVRYCLNLFVRRAEQARFRNCYDRICIRAVGKSSEPDNENVSRLQLDLLGIAADERRNALERVCDTWPAIVDQWNKTDIAHNASQDYPMSDLWQTFIDQLPTEIQMGNNVDGHFQVTNLVIVFTDGTLINEELDGKSSLVPFANKDMAGTEVLVLGVRPKADHHLDILKRTWRDWLASGDLKLLGLYGHDNQSVAEAELRRLFEVK